MCCCTRFDVVLWCLVHCRSAPEYPGEQQQRDKGGQQPQRPVQPGIIAALDKCRAGSQPQARAYTLLRCGEALKRCLHKSAVATDLVLPR